MDSVASIDLKISEQLKDLEFAKLFFHQIARDEIAASIRNLRVEKGLNQTKLAALTGMKQSAISRLEQADYSGWSFPTLIRIADALDARLRVILEPIGDAVREYEIREPTRAIVGGEMEVLRGSIYDASFNQQTTANKIAEPKPFDDVAIEHASRTKEIPAGDFQVATTTDPFSATE